MVEGRNGENMVLRKEIKHEDMEMGHIRRLQDTYVDMYVSSSPV